MACSTAINQCHNHTYCGALTRPWCLLSMSAVVIRRLSTLFCRCRKMLLNLKKKKAEYDELMEKLQWEVSCHSQFRHLITFIIHEMIYEL